MLNELPSYCYGLNVCVPQNIEAVTTSMMVLGSGAFLRELGHQDRALMMRNAISALIRRDTREMTSLGHIRTWQEGSHLQTRKCALARNRISQLLDLGSPSLQNCEKGLV